MTKSKVQAAKKADFPLWFHSPSKQWCKKVKGQVFYFGTDKDDAAKRWANEKDNIHAGKPRDWRIDSEPQDTRPTLAELGNVFIDSLKVKNATTGKPGLRHIQELERTIARLIGMTGKRKVAETLNPTDFQRIKLELFQPVVREADTFGRTVKKRSPATVAGDVRRIRVFLNWCHSDGKDGQKIPKPDYGSGFNPETEVAVTKESLKNAVKKNLSASEIAAIVEHAAVNFKPIVLLSINAGIGAGDIAQIDFDDIRDINKPECWIDLPRLKTGVKRRFLLWPETQQAIQDYLKVRKSPIRCHAGVVLLTNQGYPWVRGEGCKDHIDSATSAFTKIRKSAGVERGSLYDMRRSFATIATQTLDFEAVRQCMGHQRNSRDMLSGYVQEISDDRIRKVTDHVRQWLFPAAVKPASKKRKGGA